jgi:hypothetical protein
MKNQIVFLSIFLTIGFLNLTAQNMYVRSYSGNQDTYTISSVEKITFNNGSMYIATNTETNFYNCDDIRFVAFQNYNVGIVAFDDQNRVSIFPNPVTDILNIRTNNTQVQSCSIEIYSIDGRLIHSETVELSSSNHAIQVSNFANGVYLCKINNGSKISTTKFIKQ